MASKASKTSKISEPHQIVNCEIVKSSNITMALNPNKELKQFFSIAEVSEIFNLPASLLRYWEKEFPTIHPRKTANNVRTYTREDIEEIRLVYDLVKVRNMKLAAARELIQRNREGARNSSDLLNRLNDVRSQLIDIKRALEGLA